MISSSRLVPVLMGVMALVLAGSVALLAVSAVMRPAPRDRVVEEKTWATRLPPEPTARPTPNPAKSDLVTERAVDAGMAVAECAIPEMGTSFVRLVGGAEPLPMGEAMRGTVRLPASTAGGAAWLSRLRADERAAYRVRWGSAEVGATVPCSVQEVLVARIELQVTQWGDAERIRIEGCEWALGHDGWVGEEDWTTFAVVEPCRFRLADDVSGRALFSGWVEVRESWRGASRRIALQAPNVSG